MNYHLKKYINVTKSQAIRLGVRLRIDETAFDTVALVSNTKSSKIALVSLMTDVFGETSIKAYNYCVILSCFRTCLVDFGSVFLKN